MTKWSPLGVGGRAHVPSTPALPPPSPRASFCHISRLLRLTLLQYQWCCIHFRGVWMSSHISKLIQIIVFLISECERYQNISQDSSKCIALTNTTPRLKHFLKWPVELSYLEKRTNWHDLHSNVDSLFQISIDIWNRAVLGAVNRVGKKDQRLVWVPFIWLFHKHQKSFCFLPGVSQDTSLMNKIENL